MEKILTDNSAGKLTIKWDEERFGLIEEFKPPVIKDKQVIILNPREMADLIIFAKEASKC